MEKQPAKRILSKKEKIEIAVVTIAFLGVIALAYYLIFGSAIQSRCVACGGYYILLLTKQSSGWLEMSSGSYIIL